MENRKQKSKSFIKQKRNYESWFLRSADSTIQASQVEAKQAAEQGQQKYQREAQKKMAARSRNAALFTAIFAKKAGEIIVQGARSTVSWIAGIFGGIGFAAIVAMIVVLGAILASPLGIFFSNEATPNAVPLSCAVSQINMELNTRLRSLQSGDFTDIVLYGAPPNWEDVIAVFAAYTAGAEKGTDVAQLTDVHISKLRSVFWQMCYLTSSKKTLQIPDSNPDDEIDDSRTETTLTISITGKNASQMEAVYGFSDFQNETLDYLLSERSALTRLFENTAICHQDALDLLRALPENLSPERRAVVEQALSLVGKVNYFWGGKSLTLGWDSRWGQLREVTSQGSPTTGTYRPYGLDCSGFVDWVFYNTSGGEYVLSHGGGAAAQHRQCEPISWGDAQPGDLVFYPNDDHVGIVGLCDSTGNLLIIHCASGQNNVVITDSSGFVTVGRSLLFTNIGATN